jgi:hypothetical protein
VCKQRCLGAECRARPAFWKISRRDQLTKHSRIHPGTREIWIVSDDRELATLSCTSSTRPHGELNDRIRTAKLDGCTKTELHPQMLDLSTLDIARRRQGIAGSDKGEEFVVEIRTPQNLRQG